jgi:hypothetical protein
MRGGFAVPEILPLSQRGLLATGATGRVPLIASLAATVRNAGKVA